ncbi:ATP-binding cassette domain-containing protein [Kineococcus sp. R8]|uniref:ABC transporter ATP-binding protein n=1 Tax=Kineococcus siccus TaxID=2696567 RepID=UPI00141366C0|nr:ABC transporter ATP-binding protein [Kineococcus siccus]NAZ80897.1 ATP-binding cassette domain-containing protein [Kineococcus siccus]
MDEPTAVLEARHVHRWYGTGSARFHALDDVSLQVRAGESLAVVGKSGSGKSTLMHLLALLDSPDEGDLLVDGVATGDLPARQVQRLRNERFGFVFQQFFLNPAESVLENVVLPLTIAGVPAPARRERGMAVLERFGLADKARNRAIDLSGGQKQRAALSRALVGRPSVVFADEPTGNLDSATGAQVEEELFALNAEGITLVVVTHDEELAARCGRRVSVQDGRLSGGAAA